MLLQRWKSLVKGLGLLEILLTLAVASIIIILSIGYYNNVSRQQKLDQFVTQVAQVAHGINNYFAQNISAKVNIFGHAIAPVLVKNNIVKPEDVTNIWGGGYYYLEAQPAASCFNIAYNNMTPQPYASMSNNNLQSSFCHPIEAKLAQIFNRKGQLIWNYCNNYNFSFYICIQ